MIGVRKHAPFCCAICAADIFTAEPARAPLGRGGALVAICAGCDEDRAVEKRGPERSYEAAGGLPTCKEARESMRDDRGYQAAVELDDRVGRRPSAPSNEADRLLTAYKVDSVQRWKNGRGDPVRGAPRPPRRPR